MSRRRSPTYVARIAHWPQRHDPAALAIELRGPQGRVEFRGPIYEYDGWEHSEAGRLHDTLTGPHASMLHAGQEAVVHDRHEDYAAVTRLYQGQ